AAAEQDGFNDDIPF
ncbi:hypothetical protein BVZ43_01723B, partial [Haemophilus influenzae]